MPEIVVKLGESIVHRYFLDKDIINIGRARDNDIVIENLAVSRNHARIRRVNGSHILTDLNSANGTYLNGVRITKAEILDNDVVTIGKHNLIFINKQLTDEQIISDAFGSERTVIIDRAPIGILTVTKGKQKGQEFKINKLETYIGRSPKNDIRLHDWFVSRQHCVLMRQGGKFFVKDLGSWRKILLNHKLVKEAPLSDGDEIQIGSTALSFRITTEVEVPKLEGRQPRELAHKEGAPAAAEESTTPPPTPPTEEEIAVGFERLESEVAVPEAESPLTAQPTPVPEAIEAAEQEILAETPEAAEEPAAEVEPVMAEEEPAAEVPMEEEPAELAEQVIPEDEAAMITDVHEEPAPLESVYRHAAEGLTPEEEIKLWERALENKSPVIRRQAARRLKALTGKEYDV